MRAYRIRGRLIDVTFKAKSGSIAGMSGRITKAVDVFVDRKVVVFFKDSETNRECKVEVPMDTKWSNNLNKGRKYTGGYYANAFQTQDGVTFSFTITNPKV